ncbi:transporter substrate-binding domain-containing protein [Brevibacterium litoralis]|uniref:transporter substrate-binding domain-containing protein n=1 Tax=Brevibacterium litoralis TaxID=3138935 RepID=UPI0032EF40BA
MTTFTKIALSTLAAGSALALAACGGSGETEAAAGPLNTEGKLVHCMNAPYEPFEVAEGDEFVGFDIDLGKALAEHMGVEYEAVSVSFDTLESGVALTSGQCDIVLAGMAITDERASKMDFSAPYLNDNLALLTAEGSDIAGLEDIAGLNVGAQQGTTGEDLATDNGATVVQFEDAALQVQSVLTGQTEAVIANVSIVATSVAANEGLMMAADLETGEQIGAAVEQGNTELMTAWEETFAALQESGDYDALVDEWFGEVADAARV